MPARIGFTFGVVPQQYDAAFFDRLLGDLENWARRFDSQTLEYTVSNLTETRSIDAAAADLDTTRKALATLISDLKKVGIIR